MVTQLSNILDNGYMVAGVLDTVLASFFELIIARLRHYSQLVGEGGFL